MDFLSSIPEEFGNRAGPVMSLSRVGIILVIAWIMLSLSRKLIPALRKQLQKRTDDPARLSDWRRWAASSATPPR